jgi:4-amino-4-deoxy-L-arabinose transferase-like glycosyltransferase
MTSLHDCPKLHRMRTPWRAALIGAAVAALVTLPGLGSGTLWDNSETAYGEVAREISLAHDWIVLHFNGAPWFVQPPLYFWVAAICTKIFGVTTLALRLPAALATIAMGMMTAYAVARQTGMRAGIYASVILSTCLMQAIVGRLAIMDALLDLSVAAAIFWWFRAVQTGEDVYFIYGWIAAGFGFLAKGPVAPVVALLVIVPFYLWERRATHARAPGWRGWAAGIALFLAIAVPWPAALWQRAGAASIAELLGHYTVGRYTGTIESQSGPVWYYLPVIILGFFPWIAFLPSAIVSAARRLREPAVTTEERRLQQLVRLAIVWIVLPLIFFSFARTKLPNYIALALPAPALLVALYFESALERARSRSALISTAAVPLTILLVAIAIVMFSRDNRLSVQLAIAARSLIWVGGAIFAGSIVSFALLFDRARALAAPYVLAFSMASAIGLLALVVLPQAERFKPVPHFASVIDSRRLPGDDVAIQNFAGGNALIFYTRPVVYVLQRPGEPITSLAANPHSVICKARRLWLVAPRHKRFTQDTFGRKRTLVTASGEANLFLYTGPTCG